VNIDTDAVNAFNEIKARLPDLDDVADARGDDTQEEVLFMWSTLIHAILDCVMQHNDNIRPRYFPRTS